jgi:hypothetical protein
MEKSAVFCAIESICPWQSAYPRGAKLPAKIAMLPRSISLAEAMRVVPFRKFQMYIA